jgi:hypothetical protein
MHNTLLAERRFAPFRGNVGHLTTMAFNLLNRVEDDVGDHLL